MNWADYTILAILAISILISVWRGFTKEALSLLGWVVAFWVALTFSSDLEEMLRPHIEVPSLRLGAAFLILLVVTLLLSAMVNFLAVQLVHKTGLSGTDRVIGSVFGLARGAVVVLAVVIVGGLTALPRDPWWKESALLPYFQETAVAVRQHLPAEFAGYIRY
jgi:membrane protein required for colicin V production